MIDFVTEKFRAAGMLLEKQCLTFQPLHILLSAIELALRRCSLEASSHARVGAVALIERFGAMVSDPPPRQHRYRYFGVLAPNAPLRSVLTRWPRSEDRLRLEPANDR